MTRYAHKWAGEAEWSLGAHCTVDIRPSDAPAYGAVLEELRAYPRLYVRITFDVQDLRGDYRRAVRV